MTKETTYLDPSRFKIMIKNGATYMEPLIEGKVTVEWNRAWNPGKLTMNVVITDELDISHGNSVRFTIDGDIENPFFYGYIFIMKEKKEGILTCTCFDQIRYLKNKDTYTYQDISYSELLKMMCKDRLLDIGEIEDTEFILPSRIEENKEYLEMLKVADDYTTAYTETLFQLFDKGGKIYLKSIPNMEVQSMVLDENVFQDFDYESSINENTYNRIKIDEINHDFGTVEPKILEDKENIAKWGVLQYYAPTTEGNVEEKMKGILELTNKETRKFKAKGAIGNVEVRAGSLIPVFFKLYDLEINGYMLVDSVNHEFEGNHHFMDLELFNKDIKPSVNLDGIFKNEKKQGTVEGGEFSGDWTEGNSIEEKIWRYYRGQGFSEAATAGIMGNIYAECSMDPTLIEKSGGGGHGIIQWTGGRANNLKAYAKSQGTSWTDLKTQLDFSIKEMNGAELRSFGGASGLQKFKNSTSATDAAIFFCRKYERAGKERMAVRTGKAKEYYNKFKGLSSSRTPGVKGKRASLINYAIAQTGKPYSQNAKLRNSTHFDCSSLVYRSMQAVGLYPKSSYPGNTGSMAGKDMGVYFTKISKSQLVAGDILLQPGRHTAIYIGDNKTMEAKQPGVPAGQSTMGNRFSMYLRIRGIDS